MLPELSNVYVAYGIKSGTLHCAYILTLTGILGAGFALALKQHLIKAQANPSGKRVVIYIPSYTWHIGITKES